MTNQTPKQEVEWWNGEKYRRIVAGSEYADVYDFPAILAEHRKMVLQEAR